MGLWYTVAERFGPPAARISNAHSSFLHKPRPTSVNQIQPYLYLLRKVLISWHTHAHSSSQSDVPLLQLGAQQ
jgi:hypothetical protein